MKLIHKVPLALSMWLFMLINSIISISAHRKWLEMVVSASTNKVWTKITVRSYAWSFGHSDPDPSNVLMYRKSQKFDFVGYRNWGSLCSNVVWSYWLRDFKVGDIKGEAGCLHEQNYDWNSTAICFTDIFFSKQKLYPWAQNFTVAVFIQLCSLYGLWSR